MRLLYAVQGTGNGHLSRARLVAEQLRLHGVEVQYLFSGRAPQAFFGMEVFGDWWHREGLTMASRNGRVVVADTLRQLRLGRFLADVRALPVEQFDAVVCDYEPVAAWAARLRGVPSIGVGHQYALGGQAPAAGPDPTLSVLLRAFAPAEHRLGLHWQPYAGHIAPPIVDTRLAPTAKSGRVVVYLPWERQDKVTAMLKRLRGYDFVQFSGELRDGRDGNVQLRRANLAGFKRELCAARGVICNAGFELVSEALYLGKPVLAKPVQGQGEQQGNAVALERAQLGRRLQELDLARIADWLARPRRVPPQRYPDVAQALAAWLPLGRWHDTEALAGSLWSDELRLGAGAGEVLASA